VVHKNVILLRAKQTVFAIFLPHGAKHGRPYVCLTVRLSVTLVDQDHVAWKSWKLIAPTMSPTPSLFGAQRPSTYLQGYMGEFRMTCNLNIQGAAKKSNPCRIFQIFKQQLRVF